VSDSDSDRQTRLIWGGALNRLLRSSAPLRLFRLNTHFVVIQIVSSIVVRFRSHSLLPRDMADSAFVSSTGDVEEQPLTLGPRLNALFEWWPLEYYTKSHRHTNQFVCI